MKAAIYSRKSKITESGDSIKNQINICKSYAEIHFNNAEFLIYEDNGYSGGTTERPMFKKLINDIKNKQFDILICYRLDRISRSVADFAKIWEMLEYYNIIFVSVTENFDTSSPLGKAMLSIASVFAELERNTTGQRIYDNFTELSKTGRYLMPNPPEGFNKIKINKDGKNYYKYITNEEESKKIKMIYNKYIDLQSISLLKKYCYEKGIITKSGNDITSCWLVHVLKHELYAEATEDTYYYFKNKGYSVISPISEFKDNKGIYVYRRTKKYKGHHMGVNDAEKTIIAAGTHKAVVEGKKWLEVQKIINKKSCNSYKKTYSSYGILNGLLKCSTCGSFMRPYSIRKDGTFTYVCTLKEKTKGNKCSTQSLRYHIDNEIIKILNKHLNNQNESSIVINSYDTVKIRNILKNIINEIIWDGNEIKIIMK